jgi:hypothetical protein
MALNEKEKYMSGYWIKDIEWSREWELIRQWRNGQISILRQDRAISVEEQEKYVKRYEIESNLALPPEVLYVFYTDGLTPFAAGKAIGYGGLVHILWEDSVAEVSYLVDPVRKTDLLQYTKEWLIFLDLLREKSKEAGIKTWRAETPFSTDPTRKIHVEVIRELFKPRETMLKNSVIQEWEI